MATELMEYRPGKWVKVIDGRIAGRATDEEVAAWRHEAGRPSAELPASLTLDVDLGQPPEAPAGPARALEAPLQPAFERRGRKLPAPPAGEARRLPGPLEGSGKPPERALEAAAPAGAILRSRLAPPPPSDPAAPPPVLIRRKARPAAEAQADTQSEVVPLPKPEAAPQARPAAPAPSPRPAEPPRAAAAETPAAEEPAEPPISSTRQGPSYWWIWNVHHQPVEAFLKEWAARYQAKFGHPAEIVFCHQDDLAAAQACGLEADVSPLVQPGHFYLGHKDSSAPEPI